MISVRMRNFALVLLGSSLFPPLPASSQDVGSGMATERPELSPMARVAAARAEAAEMGNDEDSRVYGGDEARPGEWPFQVALLTSRSLDDSPDSQPNAQFCGGSLIAKDWVLTAAHCLVDEGSPVSADSITVLTGATALNEGKRIAVAEVIVNEKYSAKSLDNDIGLLRLAAPATQAPVALGSERAPDAGKATVTGWGRMQDGTFPLSLMKAELDLQPNAACNQGIKSIYARDLNAALEVMSGRMRYSEKAISGATAAITTDMADPLTDNMVCAGTTSGVRDACNGDSGGPLFTVDAGGAATQVGIVSWGEGPYDASASCGYQNAFGVYTRLSNYRGWIKGKTGL